MSALSRALNWRCPLSLESWTGSVRSLSNLGLAVSALSRTLNWRCPLYLEPWTGSVGSLSRTLIASQVLLESLALLVGARSSRLNRATDTK